MQTGEALRQFGVAFDAGQSGLGVAVQSSSKIASDQGKRVNASLQQRLEGGGFKGIQDAVTLNIKTPAQLVRDRAIEGVKKGEEAQGLSYQGMMDVAAQAPGALLGSALNTFVTHLIALEMKKIFKGTLYYSIGDATCALGLTGCGGVTDVNYGSSPTTGGENGSSDGTTGASLARQQNSDLITPPLQADAQYNPIDQFTLCPDNNATPMNCVWRSPSPPP